MHLGGFAMLPVLAFRRSVVIGVDVIVWSEFSVLYFGCVRSGQGLPRRSHVGLKDLL